VFYRNKTTNEVIDIPPNAYKKIPAGKSKELILGEAAQLLLGFIKGKISKHIEQRRELKEKLEHPLTAEELRRKEKLESAAEEDEDGMNNNSASEDDDDELDRKIPLSAYQYDIETIEMLAENLTTNAKINADKDPVVVRTEARGFLKDSEVRTFDDGYYIGATMYETDMAAIDIPKLRNIVEDLSILEDKLDRQIGRVRNNLKDFSFVLMEKVVAEDRYKEREMMLELQRLEKERRHERRRLLLEKREKDKQLKEEMERQLKERQAENEAILAQRAEKREANEKVFSMENENLLSEEFLADSSRIAELDVNTRNDAKELERSPILVDLEDVDRADEAIQESRPVSAAKSPASENIQTLEEDLDSDAETEDDKEAPIVVPPKDYGTILFGDLQLGPAEPDVSEEFLQTCSKLVSFAIFCGYTNMRMVDAPTDETLEFSLDVAAQQYHGNNIIYK